MTQRVRAAWVIAAAEFVVLASTAGRYGYHRDELYFLAAGRHLAWGYPDQPPLVPALSRVLNAIAPNSLVVLRLPSALVGAIVVLVTASIVREFRGDRRAEALAAGAMGVAAFALGACHLLSTSTFDLLAWTVLTWLIVRVLRTGDERLWLLIGIGVGIGLQDSNLVAFLMAGVVVGLLIAGPRNVLASPWLYAGGAIAVVMWAPYLGWQAQHGWPQFAISRAIAAGKSGSSQPRSLFIPYQFGLVSPFFAPVWIGGLVRLLRDDRARWCRAIGWAYLFLTVVFIATGGKAYYIAGMFPVLLGAGAQPAMDWITRARARRVALGAACVLSLGILPVVLPIVPVKSLHRTGVIYDAGETVGWPTYVREIAAVYRPGETIVASNYGEAGAVDRFGGPLGLPHAFSGQTGYWYWGPPPPSARLVLAIGADRAVLTRLFSRCDEATRLDNHVELKNDEQNVPVWHCVGPRQPWVQMWQWVKVT